MPPSDKFTDYLNQFSADRIAMLEQLRNVVVGQSEVIEQVLAAIFTRGHCLLVGVPGLAKTLMVGSHRADPRASSSSGCSSPRT